MSLQTVRSTKTPTAGRRSVVYRATSGKTFEGKVLGAGSVSGLKLELVSMYGKSRASRIVDNVPKATTMKSTNAYFMSWSPNLTSA